MSAVGRSDITQRLKGLYPWHKYCRHSSNAWGFCDWSSVLWIGFEG